MVCVLENNVASDFSNLGSYSHQCAFAFFHNNETIENKCCPL